MFAAGLVLVALSWQLSPQLSPCSSCRRSRTLVAALDYKHPDVAAEFAKVCRCGNTAHHTTRLTSLAPCLCASPHAPTPSVCLPQVQPMDLDDIEDELAQKGVPPPPGMSDMDTRLMLVEMRMRMAGTLPEQGGGKPKGTPKPTSFGSKFEEALYERPAFKVLYDGWRDGRDTNSVNLAIEYLNNPQKALELYGGNDRYEVVIGAIEKAMTEVVSPRLSFSGFPAAMGEGAVRMTFEVRVGPHTHRYPTATTAAPPLTHP